MSEKNQWQTLAENFRGRLTTLFCKVQRICAGKKRAMFLLGILVLGGLSGGYFWYNQQKPKVSAQEQVLVKTQKVAATDAKNVNIYSGEVRGRYESQLSFQVSGKIIRRFVEAGSLVKPGDALLQIDSRDIRQTVNIASAQVASAESQLKLAASNLERYRQLYEKGAVSKAQYDQYLSAYEVAVASARQASAQYAQGANQLDYSVLQADKAGVVAAISVEAGQVVSAGQAVVTLVQAGEREVEISVPEGRRAEFREGMPMRVKLWAMPASVIQGLVREISPVADAVTRTYRARIAIPEPPAGMTLGMTAAVESTETTSGAPHYEIPLSALYQSNGQPSVWLVNDDSVTLRPVQTGNFGKNTVQVTSGLQAGDTIVTAGVQKLREGQKVRLAGEVLQ